MAQQSNLQINGVTFLSISRENFLSSEYRTQSMIYYMRMIYPGLRSPYFAGLLLAVFVLFPLHGIRAEGFCIKIKNGRLVVKNTAGTSCPSGQAYIPTIAGAQGEQGAAGANGTARAYGFVSSAGNVNTALSSSNIAARKVSTGAYCISAGSLSPSSVMPIVSADQDEGTGSYHIAQVKSLYAGVFGCTSSEWGIYTANIAVNGTVTAADIAFSFLIP